MNKECVAIITARGGSKRIPHKNIKDFCGKPIIAYSIQAALESGIFDEVMVSTDNEEIAKVALQYGANIPFMRSVKNSDDFATTTDVLEEVLDSYESMNITYTHGCCIYPTAPFVTAKKLKDARQLMTEKDVDTVLPIVSYSFPPQRAIKLAQGYAVMCEPENLNKRSQDFETIYHDCGQFYFFSVKRLRQNGKLMGDKVWPVIVHECEMQDIDNENDWKLAELKYQVLQETL